MTDKAELKIGDKTYELPVEVGTENEIGIDVSKLRAQSGAITLDDGYGNTGSCRSSITFIDGRQRNLRRQSARCSVFQPDHAAIKFNEFKNDRQAEARSRFRFV